MGEEELKGFNKLIHSIEADTILDVGGGGLEGHNTTDDLVNHYGIENITIINRNLDHINNYKQRHPSIKSIHADYYEHKFNHMFDLIVLDLTIEKSLEMDWGRRFEDTLKNLMPGGTIIVYAMFTHNYGDENTTKMIKRHWKDFWETEQLTEDMVKEKILTKLPDLLPTGFEKDKERDEILWVALQKKQ